MSWLPLSFGAPLMLVGLLALPIIWWLLRLTPPRPQQEVFPPLRIRARVLRKEETPNQSLTRARDFRPAAARWRW